MAGWLKRAGTKWIALAAAGLGLLAVGVLVYFAIEGRRELDRELALLRASGEPELPEQLEFAPRSPGQDAIAWFKSLENAGGEWSIEGAPECAARIGAGESEDDIASALYAALRDPRRAANLDVCEAALCQRRCQADVAALALAARVDSVAPLDWGKLWDFDSNTPQWMPDVPPMPGIVGAMDVLCRDAVQQARLGNSVGALVRLRQARALIELIGEPQQLVGYLGWRLVWDKWLKRGLTPCMHILGAGTDLGEFDASMRGVEARRLLRGALVGERTMGNHIFHCIRAEASPGLLPDISWVQGWLVRHVWLDHDQATYLGFLRAAVEAADEPFGVEGFRSLDESMQVLNREDVGWQRRVVSMLITPQVRGLGEAAQGLEANLLLCRGALLARSDGAPAAQAWLASQPDPFDGEPLRSRIEEDGILTLWSVGPAEKPDRDGRTGDAAAQAVRDGVQESVRPR